MAAAKAAKAGRPRKAVPALKVHNKTGRLFCNVAGKQVYIGASDGDPDVAEKYAAFLAKLSATRGRIQVSAADLTVIELLDAYDEHAESYYRDAEGKATTTVTGDVQRAIRVMRELFSGLPVAEFGPLHIRACRQKLIDRGLSRGVCNKATSTMRRIVKWGVAEGMVEPGVLVALQAVEPLKRGRSKAPDRPGVKPVPRAHVDATLPFLSRQVAALVELGWLTGARMGELVTMRPMDLDATGAVWIYTPPRHKNEWRGSERRIYLGPRAQEIIGGFLLGRAMDAPMFSPAEAEAERRERQHAERKTPLSCGNVPGSKRARRPRRSPGAHYTTGTVRRAIERAIDAANEALVARGAKPTVAHWTPHQLRHAHATAVRKQFGLEAASTALGHKGVDVTQLYAEKNQELALRVAREVG